MRSSFWATCVLALLAVPAATQSFDHRWVSFERSPTSLDAGPIAGPDDEVDLAYGDLDKDGWEDVVIARKEPWTTVGKRTNILLMNEQGVLVDRSCELASASDVPQDQGFCTPTNDRDIAVVDVDSDGWLDVVTATSFPILSDPKPFAYPRVYMNLGEDADGDWLGLEHQEARIPQLYTFDTGLPGPAAFNAVVYGDVTGDGAPDLYLLNHDEGLFPQPHYDPQFDLDDRLLVNDGNGYFVDETLLRLQPLMYENTFGTSGVIADFNQDGTNDIVRVETAGEPETSSISYNDPNNEGVFQIYDVFYDGFEPYHVEAGDLNNDGRLDVVLGDDFEDRFLLNEGVDVLGRVIWGPARLFDFLWDQDDSYAGNIRVADLDNDGWSDVLICAIDVQSEIGTRRTHIYHNLGGEPGTLEPVLREERQAPTDNGTWIGAPGFNAGNMLLSFDLLVLDVDNDGWQDIFHCSHGGAHVFLNLGASTVCQADIGFGGPGEATLTVCGSELSTGGSAHLRVENGPPNQAGAILASPFNAPTPVLGGTVVPLPATILLSIVTDGEGVAQIPNLPGGIGPATLYAQGAIVDLEEIGGFAFTNAVQIEFLP